MIHAALSGPGGVGAFERRGGLVVLGDERHIGNAKPYVKREPFRGLVVRRDVQGCRAGYSCQQSLMIWVQVRARMRSA